jgi:hypothetical protein
VRSARENGWFEFNPLNANLITICHLLALLGAYHILHVGRISFKGCGKQGKGIGMNTGSGGTVKLQNCGTVKITDK